jgi:lipoyl(octanoyl) transferase
MAVDEALLHSASELGTCTLRFYRWSEPTLSLGYFQSYQDRVAHSESDACPCVRRATGGGAILHHHDLTYSLAIPVDGQAFAGNQELYWIVHRILQSCFSKQGISVGLFEHELPESKPAPFLCFERRSLGDVVLGGKKVCGSAQRRWKRGLLQHGSIVLCTSPFAPTITGIADLACQGKPGCIDEASLIHHFVGLLSEHLPMEFEIGSLTPPELDVAEGAQSAKFDSLRWIRRR